MKREEGETVERHPDSDTLGAFREHRLYGPAAAEVALHIGRCGRCAKVELSAAKTLLGALAFRGVDEHLSDDELDTLIDNRKSHPHVEGCAMCRAELEDLRRFDAKGQPSQRWLIAAAVAFVVMMLAAISLVVRRPAPGASSGAAGFSPPSGGLKAAAPQAPRVVASLADGAGRIALLEDGTIAGVELRSPGDAEEARAALSGRSIAIPAFVAAMPGAVRGGEANAHPPRAIEPFRSAVLGGRPQFSWTPVPEARSYRIAVFDADYEEVARSEVLNGTSWTPSKPLPAGVDLSWHVVAETGAGEISSAGSNRPEAVFRVLTPKEAADVGLGEGHYRDSHLLRGLLYSRYGLLHDAEREFRSLAEQNPGSPIARALIGSVSR